MGRRNDIKKEGIAADILRGMASSAKTGEVDAEWMGNRVQGNVHGIPVTGPQALACLKGYFGEYNKKYSDFGVVFEKDPCREAGEYGFIPSCDGDNGFGRVFIGTHGIFPDPDKGTLDTQKFMAAMESFPKAADDLERQHGFAMCHGSFRDVHSSFGDGKSVLDALWQSITFTASVPGVMFSWDGDMNPGEVVSGLYAKASPFYLKAGIRGVLNADGPIDETALAVSCMAALRAYYVLEIRFSVAQEDLDGALSLFAGMRSPSLYDHNAAHCPAQLLAEKRAADLLSRFLSASSASPVWTQKILSSYVDFMAPFFGAVIPDKGFSGISGYLAELDRLYGECLSRMPEFPDGYWEGDDLLAVLKEKADAGDQDCGSVLDSILSAGGQGFSGRLAFASGKIFPGDQAMFPGLVKHGLWGQKGAP